MRPHIIITTIILDIIIFIYTRRRAIVQKEPVITLYQLNIHCEDNETYIII